MAIASPHLFPGVPYGTAMVSRLNVNENHPPFSLEFNAQINPKWGLRTHRVPYEINVFRTSTVFNKIKSTESVKLDDDILVRTMYREFFQSLPNN